jgi:hypothetical protein
MCPGTEAKLYVYRNPGGAPEEMVSIEGEDYTSLPTAFKYRTTYDPSCTCKPAGDYPASTVEANARPPLDPEADAAALRPRPRPAPGEDPETLANRAGDFVPRAVTADPELTASVGTEGDAPVRVVGPVFGASPEQESAIITPVPN